MDFMELTSQEDDAVVSIRKSAVVAVSVSGVGYTRIDVGSSGFSYTVAEKYETVMDKLRS